MASEQFAGCRGRRCPCYRRPGANKRCATAGSRCVWTAIAAAGSGSGGLGRPNWRCSSYGWGQLRLLRTTDLAPQCQPVQVSQRVGRACSLRSRSRPDTGRRSARLGSRAPASRERTPRHRGLLDAARRAAPVQTACSEELHGSRPRAFDLDRPSPGGHRGVPARRHLAHLERHRSPCCSCWRCSSRPSCCPRGNDTGRTVPRARPAFISILGHGIALAHTR